MLSIALELIAENKRTKATFLDLGACSLENELPYSLLDCVWLESLNLGFSFTNEKGEFRATTNVGKSNNFRGDELYGLEKLNKLRHLYLNSIGISHTRFINRLSRLQSLNLSANNISDIGFLSNLKQIESLNLSDNSIENIDSISTLKQLQTLDLRSNQFADISPLSELKELKTLNLRSNQINDYSSLSSLSQMKSLSLQFNQIEELEFLQDLKQLEVLALRSEQAHNYSFLVEFKQLLALDLSSNQISDLNFLSNFQQLQTLYLSFNQISDIGFLSDIKQLHSLDLTFNPISDISPLANLEQLKVLILENNQISDISPLSNLEQLKVLRLDHNQISDISPLSGLQQLLRLELENNQIKDIEPLLPLLKRGSTSYFSFSNNPITNPPLEIVEQGKDAIIEYFDGTNYKPLNECKLIFVGEGAVGKTSLMKRVVYQSFDKDEDTTHGINKVVWKDLKNDANEPVRVNLWDFGGQHIQHSLHQFFFSHRVVYVLVLNPRNDNKADYWLEQIEKLGCDSEILVVYNWKDDKDRQADYLNNFYELRKKYPKLPEPFLLNCKSNEGIIPFRKALIEAVLRNEGMKVKYREDWFAIKRRLEEEISIGKNYINYEIYQEWCNKENYPDEEKQKSLLHILDRVGSIVFFDRPILNQLQVLNPDWISTGAYSILVAPQTKNKQGHLSWQDLKEIFAEEKEIFANKKIRIKYQENHFQFILELMMEHNLCHQKSSQSQSHEYLIPSAFGEKPQKDYSFAKANARYYRLQFESPFEMLIIHRFIARNLSKTIANDYWQSGIHIKHPVSDTFALVETNLYSKRIDCWLKGENIVGFWEIIRSEFAEILKIYKDFPFKELIEYQQDNHTVFLDYGEMLDSLRNGVKIIDYDRSTRLKNIDVLKVLSMFETPITTEKKMEEQRRGDTHNYYGGINTGDGATFGNGNTSTNIITKTVIPEPSKPEEKPNPALERAVTIWKRKALFLFLISSVLTMVGVFGYIKEPIQVMSKAEWTAFKASEWFKWLGIVTAFAWNFIVGRMLYDRYYDPSKEVNFRSLYKTKK